MKTNQHIEEKNWELLAKSIYDGNSDSSAEDFEAVAHEVFSSENESGQLLKTTKQVDLYFELKNYQADAAWEKINQRIHPEAQEKHNKFRRLFASPIFRYAAAVIVAAVLLVSGYTFYFNPSANENQMQVSANEQIVNTFALPDGTLVSLNSNTRINYPEKFNGNTREVTIEGEAFFEVKPDKTKPFIIHAGNAQIKVLGTSFSVSAYPATKQVEVIVETGRVQVTNKTTETATNELILVPGDKGTLVYASNSLQKTTNQDPNFIAWKTRNLTFKATSLSEVISNLEKVYKVNISLADPKLNELLLTAQFNNYSLDFILKVIESTFPIEVQQANGEFILRPRS
jgi:ferric-dicitrate binding protein FerR (iron transport regulator)